MKKNLKRVNKGFTLLEILLVIVAIGILASIVLVSLNPTRQINQVRQISINSDKNTIEKALQQALIDTGSYPTGVDGIQRKVCSNTVTIDCVDISELIPDYLAGIPSSTTYTVSRGNDGRVYVNTTETAANFSCPTGYIKVPGNSLYQTKDFCVMKYEAKAVDLNNPTVGLLEPTTGFNTIDNNITATTSLNGRAVASVPSGYPIARLNQPTASQYCIDAGASLISNAEWMTIARNIESQDGNWFNPNTTPPENRVGSGGLWRGHSDGTPSNALEASIDDNEGYIGTNNTPDSSNGWSGWREKRTFILSNGEIIWDLSSNIWEWTSDTIQHKDQPYSATPAGWGWRQYNTMTSNGILRYDDYRPSNSNWNSSQNVGQIYSHGPNNGVIIYAFLRGRFWGGGGTSGLFTLGLIGNPPSTSEAFGFRCVIR